MVGHCEPRYAVIIATRLPSGVAVNDCGCSKPFRSIKFVSLHRVLACILKYLRKTLGVIFGTVAS